MNKLVLRFHNQRVKVVAETVLIFTLVVWTQISWGEIYVYYGSDGRTLVTDQPVERLGFRLQHRRQDAQDIGHLLAGRNQAIQQRRIVFYDPYIKHASQQFHLDPALVKAVIRVESNFNPYAISRKGAQGLMQVMPQTAARYRANDLFSPVVNINVGAQHLSYLLKRYSDLDKALAAYNAGEETVDLYQGIPPYNETQDYVRQVLLYRDDYSHHRLTSN